MYKDAIEVMNRIYDTLMQNVGHDTYHLKFPIEEVSNQYVAGNRIYFELWDIAFEINIREVEIERE